MSENLRIIVSAVVDGYKLRGVYDTTARDSIDTVIWIPSRSGKPNDGRWHRVSTIAEIGHVIQQYDVQHTSIDAKDSTGAAAGA